MSDDEMYDDEDGYGYEEEPDEDGGNGSEEEDESVVIENAYYSAKGIPLHSFIWFTLL